MNRPPNLCLFCGQPGNMSKQHVFPDRLRRVLPRTDTAHQIGSWADFTRAGKLLRREQKSKDNQGSFANSKVRRVCVPCNGGWLKALEEECFPLIEQLITGELRILRRPEQEKITRVATSISMVGELVGGGYVATRQEEREAFKANLEPPPNWYHFIGRNGTGINSARFGVDGLTEVESDTPNFVSFTMVMGPVLIHALATGSGIEFFDPVSYARQLGLAPISPPSDWINFGLMPGLNASHIERVRSYLSVSHIQFVAGG